MAFGTATTCYVPIERRRGGKGPAQRRSFKGALLGYVENMPAYRIWDLQEKKIKSVSFNFTICHEGYYPFRDKTNWPEECSEDPEFFSPTIDGVISTVDFEKFKFDPEDTSEIFSLAPGLLVDRPPPLPARPAPVVDSAPPVAPEASMPPEPPTTCLTKFWQDLLDKNQSNLTMLGSDIPDAKKADFDKPIAIAPPATLREAKQSPWWKFYREAIQLEYDGHVTNGTWEKIPLKEVPPGANILRGKWILDDKRGEDGKI